MLFRPVSISSCVMFHVVLLQDLICLRKANPSGCMYMRCKDGFIPKSSKVGSGHNNMIMSTGFFGGDVMECQIKAICICLATVFFITSFIKWLWSVVMLCGVVLFCLCFIRFSCFGALCVFASIKWESLVHYFRFHLDQRIVNTAFL